MQALTPRNYKFDEFELDVLKRQLLRAGKIVSLNPKAFDLLFVLVENNGKLLSKDDLFRLVWENQIVEESNLTVNMSAIRRALGEKASQPRFITTVSGQGYRFVGNVREVEPIAVHSDESEDEFVVETRTVARAVVEEEAESEKQIVEILPIPENPLLPPKTESFFKRNRAVLVIAGVICALILSNIYFLRNENRSKDSAALPFQQMSIKRLTTNGKVTFAALAPDGKLFAYSRQETDGKQSLWLEHADGGEQRQILAPAEVTFLNLSFAPDGRRLYYQTTPDSAERATLFRMPVFGGVAEKIKENFGNHIAFAQDGKSFAFVRFDSLTRQSAIIIAETENSNERLLLSRPPGIAIGSSTPTWSQDGKFIAFSENNEPDGTKQDIFVASVIDGTVTRLTELNWEGVRSLEWAKDGGGLYAIAADKNVFWDFQIWHVSYPNGASRKLVTDLNVYGAIADLSADNEALLTIQQQHYSNIWIAPAGDLSAAKQITFDSVGKLNGWNGLDWTIDGRIIFTGLINKNETIWAMNADGANQKQLVPENGISVNPSVSDDGKFAVFDSNRSGSLEIWRASLDGSDLKQLTTGGRNTQPHVAPDGKSVIYRCSREDARGLWRISIEGGAAMRLTEKPAEWARFSPDGKQIAYGFTAYGKTKIGVIASEGGEPSKIFDVPRTANLRLGIHWTPDGASVSYRDWANGIWKQNLSGGEPERLKGLPEEKLYSYGWSRDGKQFAFTRGAEIRDVVLIKQSK